MTRAQSRLTNSTSTTHKMFECGSNKTPGPCFYCKEKSKLTAGALNGENAPFTIGMHREWQVKMMIKYGNHGEVSLDATFSTNKKKVRCGHSCYIPFGFAAMFKKNTKNISRLCSSVCRLHYMLV